MTTRLDRSNILRLEELAMKKALEIYSITLEILRERLAHVSPNMNDISEISAENPYVKRTISLQHNAQVVGGLVYEFDPDLSLQSTWYGLCVRYIGVAPSHEGKGAGSLLIQEAEDTARKMRIPRVNLKTFTPLPGEVNLPEWYQKRGYKVLDTYVNTKLKRTFINMQKYL